jgi:hypothetical protein
MIFLGMIDGGNTMLLLPVAGGMIDGRDTVLLLLAAETWRFFSRLVDGLAAYVQWRISLRGRTD